MKNIIKVKLKKVVDNSYPVVVGAGALFRLPALLKRRPPAARAVIITDAIVKKLWAKAVLSVLKKTKLKIDLLSFTAGEKSKTQATVSRLHSTMFKRGYGRDTLLIALGGGVVGDLAGFVAATYMRGLPYIQVPTTLLAMVDSSLGGKTGIDTPQGKNLIGAFHQPQAVVADINFLRTLSRRRLADGLAEALKIFLTSDAGMFKFLEDKLEKILAGDKKLLLQVIYRAIQLKAGVVARDEKESGERVILNFGHSVGHALEQASGYRLLHGEAVGLGILAESKISELYGKLSRDEYLEIERIICRLGINKKTLKKYGCKKIIGLIELDKKIRRGVIHCVLLDNIGSVCRKNKRFAQPVDKKKIIKSLECFYGQEI